VLRHLVILTAITLAACATPPLADDTILVETRSDGQLIEGASCAVNTNNQTWTVRTPDTIAVGPSDGDVRIVCEMPGYRPAELVYRVGGRSRSGMGVQVAGGTGGVGVGLSLPIGRRSVADYPSRLTVEMNRQTH
jgi:hypothetical protein